MKQNRNLSYDLLRIIAMVGVILIHANSYFLYSGDPNTANFAIHNIYTSIFRFAPLAFMMISGAFLLEPSKELDTRKIYAKYIFRTFLALAIFNTIYLIYNYYYLDGLTGIGWMKMAVTSLVSGGVAGIQFWYLYAAIWLYMITPLLRIITKNATKKDIEYLLAIGFVFTVFLPTITSYWKFEILAFDEWTSQMHVSFSIGYMLYYLMGYYINHYWSDKFKKYNKYIYMIGFVSLVFTIFIGIFLSRRHGEVFLARGFENFSINIFFFTISLFLFFKNLKLNKIGEKSKKIIKYLSSRSFGIYLIHFILIKILVPILPNINSLLLVPLFTLVITMISLVITELLGLIPFFRKKIFMY